ncbi:MAG: hypothetical protein AVDCRST_MAG53-3427 [uncultured Solirubrobacteraceae bacterium]|uniref:Uncharacterized protein n=1 Tax=uncultured Solirubrobacteraceae bacterium TaxID=1162706 RepID=A0A6J4THD4_9ACTN|nr:MAG: hypothetical protein AVDCRST_MAG53-3427 [uncultured Solirubrobacteraceae bacterium]
MSPAGGLLGLAEPSGASGVSADTIEHQREGPLRSGFRAGGHDGRLGFTVVETLRDRLAGRGRAGRRRAPPPPP